MREPKESRDGRVVAGLPRGISVALAAGAALSAAVVGTVVGAAGWDRPEQLLVPPYVDNVPSPLLAAFIATALLGLVAAAMLHRSLVPDPASPLRVGLLVLTAVMGTAAATWSALYVTAIENAIPVLDWAFFTVPVAVTCMQTRTWSTPGRPIVTGLLVALPIAAVTAFGWTVYGDARFGLIFTLVSGGFGVLFGLAATILASDGSRTKQG